MSVILIAFERESEQSALETLLSGRGHRVVKSSNGLAALDSARKEPPQAIVSDIVLPRMDGFALCRKWKQDERLQNIPFLFYTRRHDDPKYERFALELGAERFLSRTTAPDNLLIALDELLPNGQTNGHTATGAFAAANGAAANGHGNGTSGNTRPMTMLDTQAIKRMALLEKSQADALERAQLAQRQQAAQTEALEKAQRQYAAQTEALERAQRQLASQAEALDKAQRLQASQAEALDKAQRQQATQAEALEKAQRQLASHAEALDKAQRQQATQAEALDRAQRLQAPQNEAFEKTQRQYADQTAALEKAQRQYADQTVALERAQRQYADQTTALEKAQRQFTEQAAALEKVERQYADQTAALEKAQRQYAEQTAALENAQRQQALQAEALEKAQKLQATQAEALERAQRAQTEATERLERAQVEAHEKDLHAQAQADALDRAMQAHSRMRAQLTELEVTNQRLAAGEARFRRVFEGNPLPMWIADHATGGFIAVNEAALSLYGYSRAEFLALKASALEIPDAGSRDPSVSLHKRKDGGGISLSLATQRIEFDGRNADLVCAYDLTPRLEVERQLREEQAQSGTAMLDSAADGSWLLAADGQILDVNTTYCRMSGYSKEELLSMNAADIEDLTSGETTMRLQLGRVRGGGRYETKHRRKDGSLFDVEVSVGLLENAPDMFSAGDSIVLIRDIAQRRRDLVSQRVSQRQSEFLVDLFKQADASDESTIVRRVIDQAMEVTHSPLAYFYLVDPAQRMITLAAWRDQSKPQVVMADSEPQQIGRGVLFTECVRSKHITANNDASRKPQIDGLPDLMRYVAVPILFGDGVFAILGVGNRDTNYGEDDQRLLAMLGDGTGRVLHWKRSHAVTLSALQRTDVALQGMIDSFVRMSERHDPYTAGSARRLAALAVAIGREAGLDGQRQHGLRVAALLHDIGNIAVPPSILSKPAPLTETEQALMRTHVEEGCQLLAEIDFGAPVADIVYQSHERFNGSGYPRGLQGDEIMLEARILAIADTVEAMCSPRPYRHAAGMDAALTEINRGSGKLYDQHLVTACTRLIREHGFTLPE
jgi:PAS domain S-box-containing protein